MIGGPTFFGGGGGLKVDLGLPYYGCFFIELMVNLPSSEQFSQHNCCIHENYYLKNPQMVFIFKEKLLRIIISICAEKILN